MSDRLPRPLPPPPPCLPGPAVQADNVNPTQLSDCQKTSSVDETVQKWIKTRSGNFESYWEDVDVVLQNGPQCGLVCLAMAAAHAGIVTTVDEIFSKAKDMCFTKQGEMFSARNMQLLAETVGLATCLTETRNLHLQDIIRELTDRKQILIPYDADFNHEPCLKKGHKAHWALVIGFIVKDRLCDEEESSYNRTICVDALNRQMLLDKIPEADEDVFLIARQGKSKHVGIWQLKSMLESNLNLFEVDPKRNDADLYVLPRDMSELRGKFLFVFGAPATLP